MGRRLAKQIAAISPNTLRLTTFARRPHITCAYSLLDSVRKLIFSFERSLEAGFARKSEYYQATLSALLILGGFLMVVDKRGGL